MKWDGWHFVGIVVRHAELGVPIPEPWRLQATDGWKTRRSTGKKRRSSARRRKEIDLLKRARGPKPPAIHSESSRTTVRLALVMSRQSDAQIFDNRPFVTY